MENLPSDRPRILVLGAGAWHKGHYQSIRSMGCASIAMDINPEAYARFEADVFCCRDSGDVTQVIYTAREYAVDVILPLSEFGVIPAAYASEKLNLRQITPEVANRARDKVLMRQIWAEHGIDQPMFFISTSLEEAYKGALKIGFPIIVKPQSSYGARGVLKIHSREELKDVYGRTFALSNGIVLLEECIVGVETSVEGVVMNGSVKVLAFADKELQLHRCNCVTRSINYPGAFTDIQVKKIKEIAQVSVAALGINNCPFHLEVFVIGERVIPIECGARGGGGHIYSHIVKLVSGVDFVQLAVRLMLGETIQLNNSITNLGACYRFLFPPEGQIESVTGWDHALRDERVVDIVATFKPGTKLIEPSHGGERFGAMVTKGRNREEAVRVADWVESILKWKII